MADDKRFDQLKQKYQSVFNAVQQFQVRLQNVNMEGDKLLIRGEAPSQDAKNRVWDQIKMVDPGYSDLIADITVAEPKVQAAGVGSAQPQQEQEQPQQEMYTVQPGDTLSKIAEEFYGDSSQYQRIFEANRDRLSDPNKIRAGQQLVIPTD